MASPAHRSQRQQGNIEMRPPNASWNGALMYANFVRHGSASGVRVLRSFCSQQDGIALTGEIEAVYGRAENNVASMTGAIRGVSGSVRNRQASSGGTASGGYIEAIAGGVTLGTLRGAEIISDNTEGTGTITTMVGLRVRVIGAGTVTNGPWGLQIVNDAATAQAAPQELKAFIRCESSVVTRVASCIIDATDTRINGAALFSVTLTADDNVLFYYKDKDGTAHAVVAADADTLAIRT